MVLGISQETVQHLLVNVFAEMNHNQYVIDSDSVKGVFKTNISRDSFAISETGIHLHDVLVDGRLSWLGYSLYVQFHLNSGLSIDIFDFHKKRVEFSVTDVDLENFSFKSNSKFVEAFGPYVQGLVRAFGQFFRNYSLPIPAVELPYNIHLDAAIFRNENGFTVLNVDSHQQQ